MSDNRPEFLQGYVEVFQSSEDNLWYYALRKLQGNAIITLGEGFRTEELARNRADEVYPGLEKRLGRDKAVANASDGSSGRESRPSLPHLDPPPPLDPETNPNFDDEGNPIYGEPDISVEG